MKRFILEENGAAAVEYGMIIGLLALSSFIFLKILAFKFKMVMIKIFWQYLWW